MTGTAPIRRRVHLDRSARRFDGGRVLVAGSPPRVFALTDRGAAAIDAVERGDPPPAGTEALVERLVDAGALHPVLEPGARLDPSLLTVVVPTKDTVPRWTVGRCRTIVVDDASDEPPQLAGAEVVRLAHNVGPAGARNAGLAHVHTPYVAFVDSDVDVDEDTLLHVGAHLADGRTALVAPRIVARSGSDLRSRYERLRGPLDLGSEPGPVAPGSRIGYLPAATVVARTDTLRACGGFDDALRVGEDVDLVWRLVRRGERVRYDPVVEAHHLSRTTWRAWIAQRVGYGRSAAVLDRRFPGAVAPVRADVWQLAPWVALVAPGFGRRRAGLARAGVVRAGVAGALAVVTAVRLVRRFGRLSTPVPPGEALRLVGRGQRHLARSLASAVVRSWWPVTVVLAATGRPGRRALVASLVLRGVDAITGEGSSNRRAADGLDPLRLLALGLLDDAAYGYGVWCGVWRERRPQALAVRR